MYLERKINKICKKEGKRGYDKKGAISAKNKRWKDDHVRLRIYPCHDHWHLTKTEIKKKKRWK